jgi:hypothetical protein
MRLPKIFKDDLFLLCMGLASHSKSDGERYGSLLVKNGKILGRGYNRAIAHPYIHLERIIRMGYANHAEIEAMNDALMEGYNIKGADLYVAGYFPEPHTGFSGKNRLLLKDGPWFTCVRCIPYMEEYGIRRIIVPTTRGWGELSIDEAASCAQRFKNGTHEKRIGSVSTYHTLDDIAEHLLLPELAGMA